MSRKSGEPTRGSKSADPTKNAAWRKHDLSTIMLVWRLYTGGIWDPQRIRDITGKRLHASTIASLVDGADRLLNGPLTVQQPVRCASCGSKIVEVPCPICKQDVLRAGKYRDIPPPENPTSKKRAA